MRPRKCYHKSMKFVAADDALTIKLEGAEKVWALKSRLRLTKKSIVDIDYIPTRPTMQDFKGYFRIPGTALPWLFLAGTYRTKTSKEFWYVRMRTPGVLVITLRPDHSAYDRVRLTCKPELAQQLVDWWRGRVQP